MKYNSLKEIPCRVVSGTRHVDQCSSFHWRHDDLTILQGFLQCPECGKVLDKDWGSGNWYCTGCSTCWTPLDLLQAVENENTLVTVSVRNLID